MKTALRKEIEHNIKQDKNRMRNRQYIGQMKTKSILGYVLRRHADLLICIVLALATGIVLGVSL